jgi:hypothetical protein
MKEGPIVMERITEPLSVEFEKREMQGRREKTVQDLLNEGKPVAAARKLFLQIREGQTFQIAFVIKVYGRLVQARRGHEDTVTNTEALILDLAKEVAKFASSISEDMWFNLYRDTSRAGYHEAAELFT